LEFAGFHLSWLESESIHIPRESVAEARNPGMLLTQTWKPRSILAEPSKSAKHESIVMGCVNEESALGFAQFNDVAGCVALEQPVGQVVAKCDAAFVEVAELPFV